METKTNYELVMENMTPEKLAEMGVKMVSVNNRSLFYMTTTGQLYPLEEYEAALKHEYRWLMYRDEEPSGEPDKNPEPAKEVDEQPAEE